MRNHTSTSNTTRREILYLGKKYPFTLRPKQINLIEYSNGTFYIASSNPQRAKSYLTAWYRQQARKIIQQRCILYAKRAGLTFQTMSITDASTRWGSCSSQKNLHFNWRLIMAPVQVIDYVVTHELAHLTEMNHSRRFWETVRKMFPLYRQYNTWLKRNGDSLKISFN